MTATQQAQPAPPPVRSAPPSQPQQSGGLTETSPREVERWLSTGQAVLIDVREPDEHARESIAGAYSIPLSRFDPALAASLAGPAARVVFHCKGGKRSADACRIAIANVGPAVATLSMRGGIEAWKAEGLPVAARKGGAAISVLRQTQLAIGTCVLAGTALGWLVHPGFLGIPAFFGAGLVFAGSTGFCGLAEVLARMPWNRITKASPARAASGTCAGGPCACKQA